MSFRLVNWAMACLFAFATIVQYNDPDPVLWMAIYGAATVTSAYAAHRGRVKVAPPLVLAAIALVWGLAWSVDVPGLATYGRMFDHWEMQNTAVEEARETGGLLIVAGWMLVLAVHGWRGGPATNRRSAGV